MALPFVKDEDEWDKMLVIEQHFRFQLAFALPLSFLSVSLACWQCLWIHIHHLSLSPHLGCTMNGMFCYFFLCTRTTVRTFVCGVYSSTILGRGTGGYGWKEGGIGEACSDGGVVGG